MSFPYYQAVDKRNGVGKISAFNPETNRLSEVMSTNPNFDAIKVALDVGDSGVWELFDVAGGIMRRFRSITNRISYDGSNIRFDGDVIHSTLANQVQRALETGSQNYEAIARFWEKLESNPNAHSREQAYDYLSSHAFMITPEGNVVAFKGVQRDANGEFESVRASERPDMPSAYVDGVAVPPLSRVPNKVGTTVSMPRSEVVHDPSQFCSRGLHVSTRSYAESWGRNGAVVEVHVPPFAIVSVPNDARGEKVRVHEYFVAGVARDSYSNAPVLNPEREPVWAGVGYEV